MPAEMAPSREEVSASPQPMYQLVMKQQGFRLSAVEQEIKAEQLPPAIAHLLAAEAGNACLVVRRRYMNQEGSTFQVAINFYPAERYSVRTVLTPERGAPVMFTDPPADEQAAEWVIMRFV